jgi:hypothetical protein
MARVLGDSQVQELIDLLDPIIKKEGPYSLEPIKHATNVINASAERAIKIK